MSFWAECEKLQKDLVQMRRSLHQIPEVGKNLPKTRAYILSELEKAKIPYHCSDVDSSIWADIESGKEGKCVALRADMDALYVEEANEVEYKSKHSGKMHACGHDAHMAMLLGAARILNEHKSEWSGTVRLLFQTSEEQAEGAQIMIENGALQGVDAVFGQHIGTIMGKEIPTGKIVAVSGCCMASYDRFIIRVKGKGCHGSTPDKGIDPINIASHIVISLEEIIAREIRAAIPAVLTVCSIQGGNAYNIIPDEVKIEGTFRAVDETTRKYEAKRIGDIAQGIAAAFGGAVEIEIIWGASAVENDAGFIKIVQEAASEVVGNENVVTSVSAPSMIGEDFSYYLKKIPGAFFLLSSMEKGNEAAHHSPLFNIDEKVLWKGAAVFVKIVEKFMEE